MRHASEERNGMAIASAIFGQFLQRHPGRAEDLYIMQHAESFESFEYLRPNIVTYISPSGIVAVVFFF